MPDDVIIANFEKFCSISWKTGIVRGHYEPHNDPLTTQLLLSVALWLAS